MAALKHLALLVAGLAGSAPVHAQCRLCDQPPAATPTQIQSGDLELQIETSLNFDRLVLSGNGQGGAVIRPTGANGAEGAVMEIGPRATVGTVSVHGQANRELLVDLPHRIELYSGVGGRISLVDISTDLPSTPRLDAGGNLSFHFGGRLVLSGNDEGQFRGDLVINVDYAPDASVSAASLTAR
jgi:hypothetical protein